MRTKLILLSGLFCLFTSVVSGQNNRIRNENAIGWYNSFINLNFGKKTALYTEYQFRRSNVVTQWQQSLLRAFFNYNLNPDIQFRVGYAWIETYPYGEIPINVLGKTFSEHRALGMAQIAHHTDRLDFYQRVGLELRYVGSFSHPELETEDRFALMNRVRYMTRVQIPFHSKKEGWKDWYIAAYDEIMIGFGKNVNANVFDQNRIGLLVGFHILRHLRIEAGFLNQILQLGRQVNGQNVFQYNNGIIVNTHLNIDLIHRTN